MLLWINPRNAYCWKEICEKRISIHKKQFKYNIYTTKHVSMTVHILWDCYFLHVDMWMCKNYSHLMKASSRRLRAMTHLVTIQTRLHRHFHPWWVNHPWRERTVYIDLSVRQAECITAWTGLDWSAMDWTGPHPLSQYQRKRFVLREHKLFILSFMNWNKRYLEQVIYSTFFLHIRVYALLAFFTLLFK